MTCNLQRSLSIRERLAAALHVLAIVLVMILPLSHAAADEYGRPDIAVATTQAPDGGESSSGGEADLPCCGHASCHLPGQLVFAVTVGQAASLAGEILRPREDEPGASQSLHPPRKPPRLA
jgi:hypothetical protein